MFSRCRGHGHRLSLIAMLSAASLIATPPVGASEPLPTASLAEAINAGPDGQADRAPHADRDHGDTGAALGDYPMTREASGTSWQPDSSVHAGIHGSAGDWLVMSHAVANAVDDHQYGPRGGDETFVSGMLMGIARRSFESGATVQFRAMLSPDPLMGPSGYPLLLATGETADGVNPLIDRQHPHNLVMELSASVSHALGDSDSVFAYAGLPGEPAFGPPAFQHRLSIQDSPEAPISHHWLDSTHITDGVVTLGWVHEEWKLELSRFHGREPDEHRYQIESGALDSTAARLSWNPTADWALQLSWARQASPEQLEPTLNETRASASAIYTVPFGDDGHWSTTAAYGYRRSTDRPGLSAYVLESALKPSSMWTAFARYERIDNDELVAAAIGPGPVYTVAKASVGVIRDVAVAAHVKLGLGGLYALDFVPAGLKAQYGADPRGWMVFLRLKID